LIRKAPAALWFDEDDGGWLELDKKLTRYKPAMTLHCLWQGDRLEAWWVMGFARVLGDLDVGQA
jgi:hypothetical protein